MQCLGQCNNHNIDDDSDHDDDDDDYNNNDDDDNSDDGNNDVDDEDDNGHDKEDENNEEDDDHDDGYPPSPPSPPKICRSAKVGIFMTGPAFPIAPLPRIFVGVLPMSTLMAAPASPEEDDQASVSLRDVGGDERLYRYE